MTGRVRYSEIKVKKLGLVKFGDAIDQRLRKYIFVAWYMYMYLLYL